MKIKINKIVLENYKCFTSLNEFSLFEKTKICGKNRSGKSTIQDSYCDVLTGKMADGTNPDKIRPHGENGVDIDKADIIREIHLEIDGRLVIIKKRTFQKWRKPRGQSEEVFDGNGVDYEVDGFPYKPEKFKEYISRIISPDTLLMCSNPNVFLNILEKSTSEARKVLEKLAGFSVDQFIANTPQYADITDLTKGHSIEDVNKKLKKQLSDHKKKIDAKNTEIKYEKTRGTNTPQIDIADLELAKVEWRERLTEIDQKETALDQSTSVYDSMYKEIQALKTKVYDICDKAQTSIKKQCSAYEDDITCAKAVRKRLGLELQTAEEDVRRIDILIQRAVADLKQAQNDYAACLDWEFDETKMQEIMDEQFDASALICPTCGQEFPTDKAKKMRDDFERVKAERINEQEQSRKRFEEKKAKDRDFIVANGNQAQSNLKSAKEEKTAVEKKIEELKAKISAADMKIRKLSDDMAKVPESVDISENAEYVALMDQISKKEAELSSLDNGAERRSELRRIRNEYMSEIAKIEAQINKAQADQDQKEQNLSDLETELREMSQVAANIERQIDMVSEFSRAKNEALAKKVNAHFRAFHFEFLEYTQEGNPVECCKIMCEGTSYMSGLNGGDKKLCDIDLCRGLQEMNGLCLPIWVDEANTIDPWRIPQDLEQQLILINRDDGGLRVEEMT